MAAMGANAEVGLLPAVAMLILNSYHILAKSCILSPGSGCRVHQGRHSEAGRRDRQAGVAPAVAHHAAGRETNTVSLSLYIYKIDFRWWKPFVTVRCSCVTDFPGSVRYSEMFGFPHQFVQ